MNSPRSAPTVRALREVVLEIGRVRLELVTIEGVFSSKRVDPGSLTLLRNLPALPSTGHVLDLGCGYGAVGLAIAAQSPGLTIWATDEDELALALCRLNASRLGLTNVRLARPDAVPADIRFNAICSNPPLHVRRDDLVSTLVWWLMRLRPDGAGYFVVHRDMGAESLARKLNGRGHATTRLGSSSGYRVFRVDPQQP